MENGSDTRVFLTDFGLAKNTVTGSKHTRTGATLGTPAYMSPELARGEIAALTPASDTWALGCVLYELLTGRPAFDGETPAAVIGAVLTTTPPRLRGTPAALQRLLTAALQRDAARRYPNAATMRDDCDRVAGGRSPRARPHRRVLRWVALAGAAAAAIGLGVALRPGAPPAHETRADAAAETAWQQRLADLPSALAGLRGALQHTPTNDDLRVKLGLLEWASGDPAAAERAWAGVPEGSALVGRARFLQGLLRYVEAVEHGGSAERALPLLEAAARGGGRERRLAHATMLMGSRKLHQALALVRDMPGWDAALLRAQCGMGLRLRDTAPVIRDYDVVLTEGIELPFVLLNRAELLMLSDQPEPAVADLRRAHQLRPHDVAAVAGLASALSRAGHAGQAAAMYRRALGMPAHSAAGFQARGALRARFGDRQGALADLQAAARLRTGDGSIRIAVGRALADLERYDAAAVEFDAAIRLLPDHPASWQNRALNRARLGDFDDALADIDHALALEPQNAWFAANRAWILSRAGRWTESRADLERAIQLDPNLPYGWSQRGLWHQHFGRHREAIADFGRAIACEPGSVALRMDRADAREDAGDVDGALADMAEALTLAPGSPVIRQRQGEVLATAGRSAEARAILEPLVAERPDLFGAHIALGQVRLAQGDPAAAGREFEAAMRLQPENPLPWYNRGVVRWTTGDPRGAEADYDAALQRNPKYVGALRNRGVCRYRRGDYTGAIADYTKALSIDDQVPEIWVNRAFARRRSGDVAGALADADAALRLRPGDVDALLERGYALQRLRRLPESVQAFRAILSTKPRHYGALVACGDSYATMRDATRALQAYDAALAVHPDAALIRRKRGLVRLGTGDRNGAVEDLRAFLAAKPNHPAAARVRELLRQAGAAGGG